MAHCNLLARSLRINSSCSAAMRMKVSTRLASPPSWAERREDPSKESLRSPDPARSLGILPTPSPAPTGIEALTKHLPIGFIEGGREPAISARTAGTTLTRRDGEQ